MKKILLFLSIFILSFTNSYWDEFDVVDETKPEISNLSYNSYLDSNSEITINWANLNKCNSLTFNGKSIKYKYISETNISFYFSDLLVYNWTINLNCWWVNIGYNFWFPYIKNIWYISRDNDTRFVTIYWSNLEWWNVYIEEWSFKPETVSSTMITWYLWNEIWTSNFYIINGSYKSNLFKLDLKLPKINFIYGDNWLLEWEDIYLYWENFNNYNNTKVYFWDVKVDTFEILDWWKKIKLNLDWIIWNNNIAVESNSFFSNRIPVKILWNRPNITTVMEKYLPEKWNLLYIYWENFSDDIENTKVYINWEDTLLYDIKPWLIILETYLLNDYNNHISVISSWVNSNIYNYVNSKTLLPEVIWLEVLNVENWKRNIRLSVRNFKDWDSVYLDESKITPEACISWVCRIKLSPEVFKWVFRVWRFELKSPSYASFNLKNKYQPYIEKIKVIWWIKAWSDFEIIWKNFYDSNIWSDNFLRVDKNWYYDIEISDSSIKWKIKSDLNMSVGSNISIEKYWLTYSSSFSPKTLWEFIYSTPYIYWFTSNDYIVKEWSKIKLDWVWFREGDIVFIWRYKTKLNISDNSFIIPEWVDKWLISIYIENDNWSRSNWIDIFVLWFNDTTKSKINVIDLEKNTFSIDNNWFKDILYNFKFDNSVDDFEINSFTFDVKIDWDYKKLGVFSLYNWSKYLWDSMVSQDWKLKFNYNMLVEKNNFDNNFLLYNKTPFIKEWNLDIKLSSITWKYINYKDLPLTFSYPDSFFRNFVKWSKSNNCVDSQTSKINCNSFLQWNYSTETKTETTTNPIVNDIKDTSISQPIITKPTTTQIVDYTLLIWKTKSQVVKNLIIYRTDLNKTISWKKYSSQLDILIPKMNDSKKYQLLQKIYTMKKSIASNNSIKYLEIKKLLNFMESRIELELLN